MIIASWNILNDWAVPLNSAQSERVEAISRQIVLLKKQSTSTIIYLCECETVANIMAIAQLSGLVVIGEPSLSRSRQEYSVFLADDATAKKCRSVRHVAGYEPNSLIEIQYLDKKIVGVHFPAEVVGSRRARRDLVTTIIDLAPDIFLGDLNTPSIFPSRTKYRKQGYIEAHEDDRPIFPSNSSRRKNNPFLTPCMNLDALYHKPNIVVNKVGYVYDDCSDHPLIWAIATNL
jgi:hypothetical protein